MDEEEEFQFLEKIMSPSVPNPLLCSKRRHQRIGGNGRGRGVPVPGEGLVPQSQELIIHYYVSEEDTREGEEMDEEEEFQLQEKIMFPKCSLSNIMFLKKTPEKRRKWSRRKSSSSRKRSCFPSVPYPLLCSRRRHQRRGGNGRGGRVPVPGEDHVPESQSEHESGRSRHSHYRPQVGLRHSFISKKV